MVWKNRWIYNELRIYQRKVDSKLYYKVDDDGLVILLLYVDDLFLTCEDNPINECKKKLSMHLLLRKIFQCILSLHVFVPPLGMCVTPLRDV